MFLIVHSQGIELAHWVRLLRCGVVKLHKLFVDVRSVDEGDAESMTWNQLLRQLQGRGDMTLRRKGDYNGVQLPHILGPHHVREVLTRIESHRNHWNARNRWNGISVFNSELLCIPTPYVPCKKSIREVASISFIGEQTNMLRYCHNRKFWTHFWSWNFDHLKGQDWWSWRSRVFWWFGLKLSIIACNIKSLGIDTDLLHELKHCKRSRIFDLRCYNPGLQQNDLSAARNQTQTVVRLRGSHNRSFGLIDAASNWSWVTWSHFKSVINKVSIHLFEIFHFFIDCVQISYVMPICQMIYLRKV